MNAFRQAILGAAAALISGIIVIGGLTISLVEGGVLVAQAPAAETTPAATSSPSPLPPVDTPEPGQPTFTPSPTPLPTNTATHPPLEARCPSTPAGWTQVLIQPGDTLESLALAYNTTPETLRQGNCLLVDSLLPGTTLLVPALPPTPVPPTATATVTEPPPQPEPATPCGPPAGWVPYTVRRGDTLFNIALATGSTVPQLQRANCLSSTVIRAGQSLYVPRLPIRVTPASPTPRPTSTPPPTATSTPPPPPTATLTLPPIPTATPEPTAIPSFTPLPPTPTDPPTATESEEPTPTLTPVPSDTPVTPESSASPEPSSSETPSVALPPVLAVYSRFLLEL